MKTLKILQRGVYQRMVHTKTKLNLKVSCVTGCKVPLKPVYVGRSDVPGWKCTECGGLYMSKTLVAIRSRHAIRPYEDFEQFADRCLKEYSK